MRCTCCNRNLNDYESTLKSLVTGDFLDTCTKCLKGLNIEAVGNGDLLKEEQAPDDFDAEEYSNVESSEYSSEVDDGNEEW